MGDGGITSPLTLKPSGRSDGGQNGSFRAHATLGPVVLSLHEGMPRTVTASSAAVRPERFIALPPSGESVMSRGSRMQRMPRNSQEEAFTLALVMGATRVANADLFG